MKKAKIAKKLLYLESQIESDNDVRTLAQAADLIESLQAQLSASFTREIDLKKERTELRIKNLDLQTQLSEFQSAAAEYGIDAKTMLTLAKSQISTVKANVELDEQLSASQARERAAVEDMKSIVCNQYPKLCAICKRCSDFSCSATAVNYCAYFKWRGLQEGEVKWDE